MNSNKPAENQAGDTTSSASIIEEAEAIRADSKKLHRHSDAFLYAILARCLALAARDPASIEQLRRAYGEDQRAKTNKRVYIERSSDAPQVVCRYVFREEESRANVNRYAHALRQAQKRDLTSETLVEWLKNNGGINALYLTRPLERNEVTTKAIRLAGPVTHDKDRPFTLTLVRLPDNSYRVMEFGHV